MPKLVFDIETIGEDFDSLDSVTKETLTHWIKRESNNDEEYQAALEDLKSGMGFSALTGEIVAIGVLDVEKNEGAVYFQARDAEIKDWKEEGIEFRPMSEKEMLAKFWELAKFSNEFISFNGRGFDVPFLMARSAIHKIRPSKDLLSNRYLNLQKYDSKHVDLLDQLTFYGAVRRRGGLHLWCRAFGIKSPKAEGITGNDVATLFKEKKFSEIAKYNVGDLRATKELYEYWDKYVRF